MFKMLTKIWGGGKTLVKSKVYIFLTFFMIVATIVVSSQNLVNAAPKKKAVRSASNKKGVSKSSTSKPVAKRAASSGNSKRAASSTSSKRAASSSSARKVASARSLRGGAKKTTTDNTTTSSASVGNVCPIGVMLKKVLGNDGNATYYSAKNTACALPEDNVSVVNQWVKANVSSYPLALQKHPSWMSDSEAVYLTCTSGYVEKTVNKVKSCVIFSEICPLGEIVEKSGDGFIHPSTRETCVAPENAITSNVRGEENTLSYSVADDNAYKFECPSNFYSVITNTTPALRVGCVVCPAGYSAPVGATSASECVDGTAVAKEKEAVKEPVKEVEEKAVVEEKKMTLSERMKAQVEKIKAAAATAADKKEAERLAKLRIKKVEGTTDDYTCVDGWTNNWTYDEIASKTNFGCKEYFRAGFIMDKNGMIKNVVDRNAYGKNKKGCPIKLDKYLEAYYSLSRDVESPFEVDKSFVEGSVKYGVCSNSINVHYNLSKLFYGLKSMDIVLCPSVSDYNYTTFKPILGVLKKQMTSSDIDNTGVNGWTEEEYNAWGGYRPIIGVYYKDILKLEGRKRSANGCSGLSSEYYYTSQFSDNEMKYKINNRSEKNLFTYWD